MYSITVKDHFDSAHYIRDYQGKCSRQHGHTWYIDLVLTSGRLHALNMLVDFAAVKTHLKKILDKLDHYQLNEVLAEPNVTAEYLSKWIYDNFKNPWIGDGVNLDSVTIWESPNCGVKYSKCPIQNK